MPLATPFRERPRRWRAAEMSCAKGKCSTDRANYSNLSALTTLANPIAASASSVMPTCCQVVVRLLSFGRALDGLDHVCIGGGGCFRGRISAGTASKQVGYWEISATPDRHGDLQ